MPPQVEVFVEAVRKRAFAVALDWPGWTRGGRDEEDALEALLRAGPRYAAALGAGGVAFDPAADHADLVVVERVPGNSGTEFGAPSIPPGRDAEPLAGAELERYVAILLAAWGTFDTVAVRHAGDELRKGPRGGGRDVPKMAAHVREADAAYLVQLGSRPPKEDGGGTPAEALREAALATLQARATGRPVPSPSKVSKPWAPRYYVRRAAWHALDHAWEIEDRAIAAGA